MHPARKKHLLWILASLAMLAVAVALVLYALRNQANYYYNPYQISQGQAPEGKRIKAGGMVVAGSVHRGTDPLTIKFAITDYKATVPVEYTGVLPDLFKEGSGMVGTGMMQGKVFVASEILAKHDENYMPPEVAKSLAKR